MAQAVGAGGGGSGERTQLHRRALRTFQQPNEPAPQPIEAARVPQGLSQRAGEAAVLSAASRVVTGTVRSEATPCRYGGNGGEPPHSPGHTAAGALPPSAPLMPACSDL